MPNVFVTIPIQSQEPTSSSSSGGSNNGNEIKSEPIKIEISEKSGSITDITTTVTTTSSKTSSCRTHLSSRSKKAVICFKCDKCPFISLSQAGLSSHEEEHSDETTEDETNKKLLCPGCENVFYAKNSLENHLLNDHQMNKNEIDTLVESLVDGMNDELEAGNPNDNEETNLSKQKQQSVKCSQKIFIKNVDNLKEPQQTRPKSKIYIKNVDILKNPIYLHPPAEIQIPPPPMSVSPAEPIPMNGESFMNDFPNIPNDIIDLNSNSNSNIETDHHDFHFPITIDCDHNRHRTISGNSLHLRTVDELNLLNFNDMQNFMSLSSRNDDNQMNRNNDVVILDEYDIIPDLINSNLDTHLDGYQEMHHDFDLNQSNGNNFVLIGDYLQQEQQSIETCEMKDAENNITEQNFFFPCDSQTEQQNTTMSEEDNRMDNQQEDIVYVCAEEIINEPQQFFPPENLDNQDEDNNDNQLMISENTFAVEENVTENETDQRSENSVIVHGQNNPDPVLVDDNMVNNSVIRNNQVS